MIRSSFGTHGRIPSGEQLMENRPNSFSGHVICITTQGDRPHKTASIVFFPEHFFWRLGQVWSSLLPASLLRCRVIETILVGAETHPPMGKVIWVSGGECCREPLRHKAAERPRISD
jgi:hypothetical protein